MREGTSGIDTSLVPQKEFMKDVLCADCHLYSTGPPQNVTGHSFTFKPEACADCHTGNPRTFDLTADLAQTFVNAYKDSTFNLREEVGDNLIFTQLMIENATQYGFEIATIDLARDFYEDANYSYNFVTADKSMGAHNPQYAVALLEFAIDRTNSAMVMLRPGHVTGSLVDADGNAATGIVVRRGGLDLAITGTEGTFSFDYASGTYDFSLVKDGELVGTIKSLTIEGGLTADAGENEVSFSTPTDWSLPLLVIVIVLVIIVLLLAFKPFGRKGEQEEKPSEEPEADEEEISIE
jgi:hypothetical protein